MCRGLKTPFSGRDLCKVTPAILHGFVSPEVEDEVSRAGCEAHARSTSALSFSSLEESGPNVNMVS